MEAESSLHAVETVILLLLVLVAGFAAMARRGFANYHREWWHFTYGAPYAYYDVPIRARR